MRPGADLSSCHFLESSPGLDPAPVPAGGESERAIPTGDALHLLVRFGGTASERRKDVLHARYDRKSSCSRRQPWPWRGGVCTENLIRVDAVMESPKLAE